MREIKFRAWLPGSKEMMFDPIILRGEPVIFDNVEERLEPIYSSDQKKLYGVIQLMQYTGLKDKNGVEIYEGDIVRGSAFEDGELQAGEVAWFRYGWDLAGLVTDGEFNELLEWIDVGNIEVVGNIYQNPELLEDK